MDIPEVTDAKRLQVEPGDILVVRCQDHITSEVAQRIRHEVGDKMPDGVQVIVFGAALDVEVVGPRIGSLEARIGNCERAILAATGLTLKDNGRPPSYVGDAGRLKSAK